MQRNSWISLILAVIMALSITAGTSVSVKADSGQDDLEVIWFEGEGWKDKGFLSYLGEGLCYAYIGREKKNAMVDIYGNVVTLFPETDSESHNTSENSRMGFRDGLLKVLIRVRPYVLYFGFYNTKGELVLPPKYMEASDFHDGLALVGYGGESFFIDKWGNKMDIDLKKPYKKTDGFYDGLAWMAVGTVKKSVFNWELIDKQGNICLTIKDKSGGDVGNFHDGWARIRDGEYYKFIDKQGNVLNRERYDEASDFRDGRAWVVKGRKEGFINTQGEWVEMLEWKEEWLEKWYEEYQDYPRPYSKESFFHDGVALVKDTRSKQWGVMNQQGEIRMFDVDHGGHSDSLSNAYNVENEEGKWENLFLPGGIIQTKIFRIVMNRDSCINIQGEPLDFTEIKYENGVWIVRFTLPGAVRKGILKSSLPKEVSVPFDPYVTANYSNVLFNIDGKDYDNVEGYTINGRTYYKLRDVAELLRNTESKFSVEWDESAESILIRGGEEYLSNGSELKPGDRQTKKARVVTSLIRRNDGAFERWMGYSINGYSYFPIRDLGNKLDFEVEWGEPANYKDNRGRINIRTVK